MHSDDGVERIGFAGEHGASFELFGECGECLDVAFEIGEHVFAFAGKFEVGIDVAGAAHKLFIVGDKILKALAVAHDGLADAAGSFQRAGSASFFSMSASSLRMRAGSKILPQVANLVAHGSISEFEIV